VKLLYPSNHVSNFSEPLVFSNPRTVSAKSSCYHSSHTRSRVLRWREKESVPMEQSKPDPKHGSFQISDSKPDIPVPQLGPTPQQAQCGRCLGLGHVRKACNQEIRCRACFNYGHISSSCLSKKREKRRYRVVSRSKAEVSQPQHINSELVPILEPSVSLVPRPLASVHQENPNPSAMANWAVNPRPFVPAGFKLEDPSLRPLL
jgi:hypothetical protein